MRSTLIGPSWIPIRSKAAVQTCRSVTCDRNSHHAATVDPRSHPRIAREHASAGTKFRSHAQLTLPLDRAGRRRGNHRRSFGSRHFLRPIAGIRRAISGQCAGAAECASRKCGARGAVDRRRSFEYGDDCGAVAKEVAGRLALLPWILPGCCPYALTAAESSLRISETKTLASPKSIRVLSM